MATRTQFRRPLGIALAALVSACAPTAEDLEEIAESPPASGFEAPLQPRPIRLSTAEVLRPSGRVLAPVPQELFFTNYPTRMHLSDTLLLRAAGPKSVSVYSVKVVDEESLFGEGAAASFVLRTAPLPAELTVEAPLEIRVTYVPSTLEMRRAVLVVTTNADNAREIRVTLVAKFLSSTLLEHAYPFAR